MRVGIHQGATCQAVEALPHAACPFCPFAAVPKLDSHGLIAEFKAAFSSALFSPSAPRQRPLVRAEREREHHFFPTANDTRGAIHAVRKRLRPADQ